MGLVSENSHSFQAESHLHSLDKTVEGTIILEQSLHERLRTLVLNERLRTHLGNNLNVGCQ